MFNTISVQFIGPIRKSSDKEYAYLSDIDNLKVGDIVVVDTQHGLQTAKVSSLFCDASQAHRWVVCTVPTAQFEAKLEDLKRKQFILKQMKQRADQVNDLDRYTALAKSDPAMAQLLEAFNTNPNKVKELAE